jgi:predicted MFS family arabinose efflux permease
MPNSPAYLIGALTLLNVANYLDRYLVAALGPYIQLDLGLSDASLGLIGSAFLWGFLAASFAVGYLGKRCPCKALMVVGAAIWALATIAFGWSQGFMMLLLFRLILGLGQAAFTVSAPTFIDDNILPAFRGRALAVFSTAIPIGAALAYSCGGLLGEAIGWRWTMIVSGLSVTPLVLLLVESKTSNQPLRQPKTEPHEDKLAWLASSKRYLLSVAGYAAQTFAIGGFAFWIPTYLTRQFDLPVGQGNMLFGIILVITGFGGTLLGGFILDKLGGHDRVKAALKLSALLTLIGLPFGYLAILTASAPVFFLAMAVVQFAVFATLSPINTVFLGAVSQDRRTNAMAFAVFSGRLFGDMVSIWLVGAISDATQNLNHGLMILPLALSLNFLLWFGASRMKR